jgi:hypothetical protein
MKSADNTFDKTPGCWQHEPRVKANPGSPRPQTRLARHHFDSD